MPIDLRAARPVDREFLFGVYASTRAEELAPVPWTDAQKEAFLRGQFEAQDRSYAQQYPAADRCVVVVDGEDAGRLYVDRGTAEIAVIDIALLPRLRARGIGSALLREVLDEADATGRTVAIHVELGNRARSLYERLGFREVSTAGLYALLKRPAEVAHAC